MLTTFDKALSMGLLASYRKMGWLWLSQLVLDSYCHDCPVATVGLDDSTYILDVRPFNPSRPYAMQPGWIGIIRMQGNGAGLYIPELLPLAFEKKFFGQYIPKYDESSRAILIDLKERRKKYGK